MSCLPGGRGYWAMELGSCPGLVRGWTGLFFLWSVPSPLTRLPTSKGGFFPMSFSLSLWVWGLVFPFGAAFLPLGFSLQHYHSTSHHRRHSGVWVFQERTNEREQGTGNRERKQEWACMDGYGRGAGLLSGTDSDNGATERQKKKHDTSIGGVSFGIFGVSFSFLLTRTGGQAGVSLALFTLFTLCPHTHPHSLNGSAHAWVMDPVTYLRAYPSMAWFGMAGQACSAGRRAMMMGGFSLRVSSGLSVIGFSLFSTLSPNNQSVRHARSLARLGYGLCYGGFMAWLVWLDKRRRSRVSTRWEEDELGWRVLSRVSFGFYLLP